MSNPWMCGASMGMVFCDAFQNPGGGSATPTQANGGAGFSLLFKTWVISDKRSYYLALLGVFFMGLSRQLMVSLRVNLVAANVPRRATATSAADLLLGGVARGVPAGFLRSDVLAQNAWALLCVECALLFCALSLSYINMLIAMAYDGGLIAALVAGETVAYGTVRAVGLALGGKSEYALGDVDPADCCS